MFSSIHFIWEYDYKDNDIRSELKPLLTDQTVADETILKRIGKVTSIESKRHQRLVGSTQWQKYVSAHAALVEEVK